MNLELTKPIDVNVATLLSMLDPKRIAELAAEAELVLNNTNSRSCHRMIVENAIRKALMEAVANVAAK